MERYCVDWQDTYQLIVKFGAHEYLEERYPAVFRQVRTFEEQLRVRGQCQYSRSRTNSADGAFRSQAAGQGSFLIRYQGGGLFIAEFDDAVTLQFASGTPSPTFTLEQGGPRLAVRKP